MTRLDFTLAFLALTSLAGGALAAGCAADSDAPDGANSPTAGGGGTGGSAGTPSAGTPSVGGGVTMAGGSGVSGSASGGAPGGTNGGAGAGGGGPKQPLCVSKATVKSPSIADFESYDGVVAFADYRWIFGGATPDELGVHAGTYAFGDGSVEPALAMVGGHGGNYALQVSVMNASKWGQGWGMYFMDQSYGAGCIDASMYQGISLWVRGSVPTNTFSFGVTMAQSTTTADGGSCPGTADTCKSPTKTDLPISMSWSQVDILWADLTGGLAGDATPLVADGDDITGFSFGANLTFMPESEGSDVYVPVPGNISVDIDDMTFIP